MKRRSLSIILTLAVVLSMLPVTAWAVEPEDTGLCPHHTEHTEECGYVPASVGAPCAYERTDDSYTVGMDSIHVHDESCGYAEPTEGTPCGYVCGICAGLADEPEAPEDAEGPDAADDGDIAADAAVEEVQALIDALPAVEEVRAMDMDGQRVAYNQIQHAYDAYQNLTDEQRGLITGAEAFEKLFAFFNGQTMPLATTSVSYVNAQGQSQGSVTATVVESGTTAWSNGWYVVDSEVTISSRIELSGAVNLILADGSSLIAGSGVHVPSTASLTIWGQSGGTGSLTATSSSQRQAAIGGNHETGGHGPITINGGVVTATATGNWGAGIGGAGTNDNEPNESAYGHEITINGGVVTASGGSNAAGIGGGRSGHGYNIIITGGTVTANGGGDGAGIGGGRRADGYNISISGGIVTVVGGNNAADIGGGSGTGSLIKGYDNIISGNAVVRFRDTRDLERDGVTVSSGVVFLGSQGTVYGNVTLDEEWTIEAGETLTVPSGASLTNKGIITNRGTINSTFTNNGTIINDGGTLPSGMGTARTIASLPAGRNGLTYNGSDQTLVTAGDSALHYRVNGGGYSATDPTGRNAGTYTVEYKIAGDGIFNSITANAITVTIAKGTPSVTAPTANTLTYTGQAQTLVGAGSTTSGTMQYSLMQNDSYSTNIPTGTDAGNYTVWYKVVGDTNYNDVAAQSVQVTIGKATPTVTRPTANTLTYTGQAQQLVRDGSTTGGTMQYCLTQNGSYSTAIPTGTNAGDYTVWYKVVGGTNYNDTTAQSIKVTISTATPSVIAPTAVTNLTYDGYEHDLINAGSTTGGELQYSTDSQTYSANIPTGTDAGNYTVYYKVVGNDNYNGVAASGPVNVTIAQASQSKPADNIKVSKTSDSITVTSPTGTQYQYFVGTTAPGETQWKTSTSFTGLEADTKYTVYVRYAEDTNHRASEAATATVTTLAADGSATLQPGESVKTENGTVTNNGDHITVEDNEGNTTTVTPVPESGVEVDKDGSVTVPEGGKVKTGNGPERTLPEGGVVDEKGNVTADEIVVGDTVAKGDGVTADKDGNFTVPEGGAVQTGDDPEMTLPEGGTVDKGGNVTADEIVVGDTTIKGDNVTADPDGTVHVPESGAVTPPGGPDITLPEGGTLGPDGSITPEGGSAQVGDTTVTVPEDGGTLEPDGKGGVEVPSGSTVTPPGGPDITVGPGNSGVVDKDGNVTLPGGGSAKIEDTTVTVPEGGAVKPNGDGTVTVPEGSTVQTSDEDSPKASLPQGGIVDKDGTVTADEIVIGDTTVKGDGVTADKDGNLTVPEGGTVQTGDGPEMTLPEGGTVDKDGTVTADEIVVGNTTVKGEDVTADPDGTVHVPEGGVVTPPGGPDITLPEGGTVDPDGNITPEGGSARIGDTTVTVPEDGGTLRPDGEGGVEVPDGSTVTPPGGPDITVGPGNSGVVDKDGNIALPGGGSAKIGDITITVPEDGGTLTPNGDGTVNVPPGSKVRDKDGKERTVPTQGGKINSEGVYEDNPAGTSGGGGSGGGGASLSTYPPSIPKAGGGKVSVSPSNPRWGNTVTVTPAPDEGYEVGEVSVRDSRGNSLKVRDNGNGTFSFTQPIGKVTIEVTFKAVSVPPADVPNFPALAFSDLDPNAWYWEAANYVVGNGLMNGYGNGMFGPNDTLSRAMLAQILYNQAGGVPVNYLMRYDDVPAGTWYVEAVRWAASEGIISGYGNGQFGPDDPITREQLAAMLYRYEQFQGGFAGDRIFPLDYADVTEISDYAREAAAWCTEIGVFSGYDDGTLRPKGKATRAEAASMLMRYFGLDK